MYTSDTRDGEASVFLDANTLSPDGTVALGAMAFNATGALPSSMLLLSVHGIGITRRGYV